MTGERTTTKVVLDKMSAQKQLEANHQLFDAALINGSAADVRLLRNHAHALLDKVLDLQAEAITILKAMLP